MEPITYQEAFYVLHRAGFIGKEIDQLYYLRQTHQRNELDQPALDDNRLRFVQWLVATGRLTDQLPETSNASSNTLPQPKSRIASIIDHLSFFLLKRKESHLA